MKQLTVCGLDDGLAREIQRLAKRDGTSLGQAAIKLMRRGAGLSDGPPADTVGDSLDHFIGSMGSCEADELDCALRNFAEIDKAMWEQQPRE